MPQRAHPHPAADQLIGRTGLQYFGNHRAEHFLDHKKLFDLYNSRQVDPNGWWRGISNSYIDFLFPWSDLNIHKQGHLKFN